MDRGGDQSWQETAREWTTKEIAIRQKNLGEKSWGGEFQKLGRHVCMYVCIIIIIIIIGSSSTGPWLFPAFENYITL